VPILVAPFGPWDEVELAVAAASAGCLASLGTAVRSVPELEHQWATLRDRTNRPFVINHTGRPFNPEAFAATLAFKPAAISFHMGIPRDLIDKAHDRGILWLQTVGDVEGAEAALEAGADVLIAQGTEAGGNGGWIGTLVLVPPIVDLAGDVPVVAAGGIADGRGIAAVLTLGAQAASLGTRFLATDEMAIDPSWKARIREASATDAVKVPHAERVMPPFTLPPDWHAVRSASVAHAADRSTRIRAGQRGPSRRGAGASSRRSGPAEAMTCCHLPVNRQPWCVMSCLPLSWSNGWLSRPRRHLNGPTRLYSRTD